MSCDEGGKFEKHEDNNGDDYDDDDDEDAAVADNVADDEGDSDDRNEKMWLISKQKKWLMLQIIIHYWQGCKRDSPRNKNPVIIHTPSRWNTRKIF